jgi:hypothetical protein
MTVYRNLKFFPDVFGEAPVDQWNIIPVKPNEAKKEIPVKSRESLEELRAKIGPTAAAKAVEQKKIAEDESKQQELSEVLKKYPAGSLQHRAVEEEIRKLSKK